MKTYVLDEPELEFAGGNRHIDPRVGITDFGPADAESATAPREIPVGVVGPAEGVHGLRDWFEKCRGLIEPKDAKPGQEMLFPSFPGFNPDAGFGAELVFDDALTRVIPQHHLTSLSKKNPAIAVQETVDLYAAEAESLAETSRPRVIICVRPDDLNDDPLDLPIEDDRHDASADGGMETETPSLDFHDLLKARSLGLSAPLQIVRNSTWSGKSRGGKQRRLQDEATRAWNIHTALYYKAGGSPWRMARTTSDLATCFVGISFYRTLDGAALHTAVAQVFNERGDGVVVRGGAAHVTKEDRQPHLPREGAETLLASALVEYKRIHGHPPARVVVHKSSSFDDREAAGFRDAAVDVGIDLLDLVWVQRRPTTRLFRVGVNPPLRGTVLELDDRNVLIYSRGTVEFYRAYPGMYVPRPLVLTISQFDNSLRDAAEEALSLSKMNWNNTQFDGREPLTLRTAFRVGHILKHAGSEGAKATRYAYYM